MEFADEVDRVAADDQTHGTNDTKVIDIQALQAMIEKLQKSIDLQGSERRSAMLMIGAMARDKYAYQHGADRQASTSKIRGAIHKLGLDLDPKTILKYCDEGSATIEKELEAQPAKRKS